jgi:CRISPR type I-D-associated protein Csc3/Cas10d
MDGSKMNWCQELVDRYTAFYMPKYRKGKAYSSRSCVKPFEIAQKTLMQQTQIGNDELQDMIAAQLVKLMGQVHAGTAEGKYILHGEKEESAIIEFSRFFVHEFWVNALNQDRARIAGNKLAIFENTCEFLVKGIKAERKNES